MLSKNLINFPLQKILSPKIFGFRIVNLTLQNKEVQENPMNQWATLRVARKKFSENELSFILAGLYDPIRRHFTKNGGL